MTRDLQTSLEVPAKGSSWSFYPTVPGPSRGGPATANGKVRLVYVTLASRLHGAGQAYTHSLRPYCKNTQLFFRGGIKYPSPSPEHSWQITKQSNPQLDIRAEKSESVHHTWLALYRHEDGGSAASTLRIHRQRERESEMVFVRVTSFPTERQQVLVGKQALPVGSRQARLGRQRRLGLATPQAHANKKVRPGV